MAVNPKLVMAIAETAKSPKVRNMILYIVLFALGLVMLVFAAYGGMISGLFCILQNTVLKTEWSYYSNSISEIFDDLKTELDDDLKEEVYDFMPDFSSALSKAILSQSVEAETVAFEEEDLLAPNSMKYIYSADTVTISGEKAKRQSLSVIDGDTSKTVEYICLGGTIYLPEFLAMYNVRQNQKYLVEAVESDASEIDGKIEEIVGGAPETEEEFAEYMKNVWKNTIEGTGSANVGIFKTAALKSIIKDANLDGAAAVNIERSNNKLSITLKTISSDTWKEVFEIDESLWDYVEQEKMTIELALNAAQIPQENRAITLDGVVQSSLFEYFDGLFEFPVSSSDFAGILSQYGDISAIHTSNANQLVNEGVILQLDVSTTIDHILQSNCGSFIEDAFIYDVWNMDDADISENSRVYNRDAVTIAYIIDVKKFKKAYGFQFPDINGVVTDSGYITLCLEYACLNDITYDKNDVGSTVSEAEDIGKAHDGTYDSRYDIGAWQHTQENCTPHIGIKVQICSGKLEKPNPKENDVETYNGLSRKGVGVTVNPALWFKGLIINSNKIPDGVSPAQPE